MTHYQTNNINTAVENRNSFSIFALLKVDTLAEPEPIDVASYFGGYTIYDLSGVFSLLDDLTHTKSEVYGGKFCWILILQFISFK